MNTASTYSNDTLTNRAVPVEVHTTRLFLRKPRLEDSVQLFRAYTSDAETVRFTPWKVHESADETLKFLRSCLEEWANGTGFPYVIELASVLSGPVGIIHFHNRGHLAQFGYGIARPYWGQGYMTEALSTLVDWSLDQPEIWRASGFCDVDNLASARVMEKAGMAFEGVLHRFSVHPNISREPRDCRIFANLRP